MNVLKKLSIKSQLLLLITLALLMISAMMYIYYYQVVEVMVEKNDVYTEDIFTQVRQSVSENTALLSNLLFNITYNPSIQDYLMETEPIMKYEYGTKVESILAQTMMLKEGIQDIVIMGASGNNYNLNGALGFMQRSNYTFPSRNRAYFTEMKNLGLVYPGLSTDSIILGTTIFSVDPRKMTGSQIGTAALVVEPRAIVPDISRFSEKSGTTFYLLDRNLVVFNTSVDTNTAEVIGYLDTLEHYRANPGKVQIGDIHYHVRTDNLPEIGGWVVGITPEDELLAEVFTIRRKVMAIFLVTIVLLSLPFMLITNNIITPINRFKSFINEIKSGNPDSLQQRIVVDGYAEMAVLSSEFNSMLDEINNLANQLVAMNSKLLKTQLLQKQSELSMLQNQINPHFLHNTLESVKGMALTAGAHQVVQMIKSLAHIFKYTVEGLGFVPLEEELVILRDYLSIQQTRFNNRFDIVFEIDEHTLRCMIPKMILQPIVENAIHHGLEMRKSGGVIAVAASFHRRGELLLVVKDNGVGMASENLERLRNDLDHYGDEIDDPERVGYVRIGIRNVHNRIRLTYGEGFGLTIHSQKNRGTEVRLNLPIKEEWKCIG